MKFDKICRTCLQEKLNLKPLFDSCVPTMLMSCASIQVMEGDGLPCQVCTQCLLMINKAYNFKQSCEKSDVILRQYINNLALESLETETNSIMNAVKTDQLFGGGEVLQQSSIFQEIFNDATSHSLVDNFTAQDASVVSDLAETMESLQTIAEQCLPKTWETDNSPLDPCHSSHGTNCETFSIDPLFTCQFCEASFTDEWTLGGHIKMHAGQTKLYYCNICGECCTTEIQLNKHTESHSNSVTMNPIISNKPEVLNKQEKTQIMCNICDQTFSHERFLKKHQKDIHFMNVDLEEYKKHVCTVCHKRVRSNKLLMVHMRVHSRDKPLQCDVCGKGFSFTSSLMKHKNLHCEKKWPCSICGRKFNQSSHLNVHLRSHTGEKPFMCNICGKYFSSNHNRETHMKIHTGEKPFNCTNCTCAFATKSQLKKHLRNHTGERPYQCWQCGKAFKRKETRDTHIRYHTGERPYACSLCPKKYIAASHLRTHLKSHSNNENKHHCNICLKNFVDLRTLKTHILTHTGEKPYSCEFCGSCFANSGTLNNHKKFKHKPMVYV